MFLGTRTTTEQDIYFIEWCPPLGKVVWGGGYQFPRRLLAKFYAHFNPSALCTSEVRMSEDGGTVYSLAPHLRPL